MAKIHLYKSANDPVLVDKVHSTIQNTNRPGRRLADLVTPNDRKLNLERRIACNERRTNKADRLNIPSRRFIVDRRVNRADRRKNTGFEQQ